MKVPGTSRFITAKTFEQHVQDIASAAHLRGVVLVKSDQIVGSVEAAVLCRALRAAHENTRSDFGRHDHVKRLANGISARLGVKGSVQVGRFAWSLITGYAAPRKLKVKA